MRLDDQTQTQYEKSSVSLFTTMGVVKMILLPGLPKSDLMVV